jgi:hypothetical protein
MPIRFDKITSSERLAHLLHDEWLARRPKPTAARISRALEILDRPVRNAPDPGDELPEGYVSVGNTRDYEKAARAG